MSMWVGRYIYIVCIIGDLQDQCTSIVASKTFDDPAQLPIYTKGELNSCVVLNHGLFNQLTRVPNSCQPIYYLLIQ